jgi:hypothetical protein
MDELQEMLDSTFLVKDFSAKAIEFLTPKAQGALDIIKKSLSYQEDGVEYKCIFLSSTCKTEKTTLKALKSVCRDINRLAEEGLIKSALSRPSRIGFHPSSFALHAVFAFVHVPADKVELTKTLARHWHEEGGVGPAIESLEEIG